MTSVHLEGIETVADILRNKQEFLLTTASPDGDSIGSMLGLGAALAQQKKKVQIFSPEPVPDNLHFLPGMNLITTQLPARLFDALIVMDTGSGEILFNGDRSVWEKLSKLVVNIDHHPDNDRFGHLNVVSPVSASTGEIAFGLLKHLDWEITPDIAECLLTALMADTGAFRYPNVTPETLTMASELLAKGGSNAKIARKLYANASPNYARLLGKMFVNLQFEFDGQLAWSVLSKDDFTAAAAADDLADKMVEQLDVLRDVKAYALLRQMEDGKIKVSLRSRSRLPVNQIAAQFGGGGHLQAAGCQLAGDLHEAEKKIVQELRKLLQSS